MSKGPTGSRYTGTTIVPSFRFSKADDQMVEVTPSSSFDDMDEDIKHVDVGSVQDSPLTQHMLTKEGNEHHFQNLINPGPTSLINFDNIDEFYGAGEIYLVKKFYTFFRLFIIHLVK